MKILSIQPGSLYQNGGAARVLRRLYGGKEVDVFSIGVITNPTTAISGDLKEVLIAAFPLQQKWMRWHLRTMASWFRKRIFKQQTIKKIRQEVGKIQYDVIHLICHGEYCGAINKGDLLRNKQLWVSFHDHYATTECSFSDSQELWNVADRRLVISDELGLKYQELFGKHNYELITDGVFKDEMSTPMNINTNKTVNIYFSGALHLNYYPLFKVLADALDILSEEKEKFNLILRGTQQLKILENRKFKVEYRTDFISDSKIKKELDSVEILYLPIKFDIPDFYLYSLSTKMVSYLGASGSILYHGPDDSAAFNLLKKFDAAIGCTSLSVNDMIKTLKLLVENNCNYSLNAKKLADTNFDFLDIKKRFWQNIDN